MHFNPPTPCGVGLGALSTPENDAFHFNPPTPCGVGHRMIPSLYASCHNFNPPTPCGVGLGASLNSPDKSSISISSSLLRLQDTASFVISSMYSSISTHTQFCHKKLYISVPYFHRYASQTHDNRLRRRDLLTPGSCSYGLISK